MEDLQYGRADVEEFLAAQEDGGGVQRVPLDRGEPGRRRQGDGKDKLK
jgi:hypothetical protein